MSRYGFVVSASRPEVAKAKILSVDGTRLEFIINDDVPVGRYRLFIGSRAKGQTAVATDSVPVEVVPAPR